MVYYSLILSNMDALMQKYTAGSLYPIERGVPDA